MENETKEVAVPVSPIGLQNLCTEVLACRKDEIIALHPGIPQNQIRSIVHGIVKETIDQLVSVIKDLGNE